MAIKIGEIEALFRYPVKSMSGEPLEVAELGWHGLQGDRRLALRRMEVQGGFPWLSASKLPELILFAPVRRGPSAGGDLPTHVRMPEGEELAVFGPELATEVGRRHGSPVEMMHLNRGIFDDAPSSVIASATVGEIGRLGDFLEGRDGVVAYTSAHLEGVESEFVVRSGHSCQSMPATIEEVRRILHEHLDSLPGRMPGERVN